MRSFRVKLSASSAIRRSRLIKKPGNQMYVPYAQDPTWGSMSLVVRTNGEPTALAGSVREAIRSVDKAVPNYNLKTMNDVVSTSASSRRVPMLLLSGFAGVAMLLAMLGIYGVTSYYVTQRTHEIGVRMALGAQIVDVLKLVLSARMMLGRNWDRDRCCWCDCVDALLDDVVVRGEADRCSDVHRCRCGFGARCVGCVSCSRAKSHEDRPIRSIEDKRSEFKL